MENNLLQIRKQLALKQSDIAAVLDCSAANIAMIERGKSSLSERNKKILIKYFKLNPMWFEDPDEPMFQPSPQPLPPTGLPTCSSVPLYDIEKIESLEKLFKMGDRGARKRPGRLTKEEKMYAPTGHINIPGLPDCDGAVRIAGDIVIYKQLAHSTNNFQSEIFWGEMYLLEIESSGGNYIAVRRLRRSMEKNSAVLVAANPDFADQEVAFSKIRALALVKATIHLNLPK